MKKIIPDVADTPEKPVAETSEELIEETPAEPKTLDDGTELVYALEDAGRNLPHLGLALEPGYLYIVGEDFDGAFGQRLVETGICRLAATPTAEEDKPADKPAAEVVADKAPEAEALEEMTGTVGVGDKTSVIGDKTSLEEMVKAEVAKELAEQQQDAEESAQHQSSETQSSEHQSSESTEHPS